MRTLGFIFAIITLMQSTMPLSAEKIQDNSFLIEEAYNQEPGIIQHIFTMQYIGETDIAFTFTEEFPVPSQTHQLSYIIPFDYYNNNICLSDILLNYRYQLVYNQTLAVTPRISIVLPTGDYKNFQGNGGYGINMNLPVSIDLTRFITTHLNAGLQYIPWAKTPNENKYEKFDYFLGSSVIIFPTYWLNVMCEILYTDNLIKNEIGESKRERTVQIAPGLRGAIDIGSIQIVPGISYIISPHRESNSLFLYLSIEHPLWNPQGDKNLDNKR